MEFITGVFAWVGAFFVLGPIFWLISAVMFGWLIYLTEEAENHFLAVVLVSVFIWIASSANSIPFSPLVWLKWFAVYMAIGAGWSFLKWFSFLHTTKDELKSLKQNFFTSKRKNGGVRNPTEYLVDGFGDRSGKFTPEGFPEFASFLNDSNYLGIGSYGRRSKVSEIKTVSDVIPKVSDFFGRLTSWIVWWPTSAFWTILNDPIRRIARQIVNFFRGAYTRMANAVFSSEV